MKVPERTIHWLLENDNPPVRYSTQTDLLALAPDSSEVRQSREQLMDYSVTRGILEQADSFWLDDAKAYWKYTGKYWQVIFLGQFLADGHAPALREGLERLLADRGWVSRAGGQCLTANLLAAFMRMGYREHPLVQAETEALARRIANDGGVACHVMAYSLLSHCYMSIPKLLLCFSLVPEDARSRTVKRAISLLAQQLIDHEVFVYVPGNRRSWSELLERAPKRKDLPPGQTVKGWIAQQRQIFLETEGLGERQPKRGWLRFGFPRHYNSDALEAMYALARVDTPMCGQLRKPLELILSKADPDQRWTMEDSLNGKMRADVERKGNASKWLTYYALSTIKHFDTLIVD